MESEGGQPHRTASPAESLTSIGSATRKTPQRKQTPAPSISSPVPPPVSPSASSIRQEYFQVKDNVLIKLYSRISKKYLEFDSFDSNLKHKSFDSSDSLALNYAQHQK